MFGLKQPIVWNLAEASTIIGNIQPKVWECGYHACLGGGVINCGYSRKDLDIFIIPMDHHKRIWSFTKVTTISIDWNPAIT